LMLNTRKMKLITQHNVTTKKKEIKGDSL